MTDLERFELAIRRTYSCGGWSPEMNRFMETLFVELTAFIITDLNKKIKEEKAE